TYTVYASSEGASATATFTVNPGTVEITVDTDADQYVGGEKVKILGSVYIDGNPVIGVSVGVMVKGPSGEVVWVDEVQTGVDGAYSSSFRLLEDAALGNYTVYVSSQGAAAEVNFTVVAPINVTVIIRVKDSAGNPVPGASVSLWNHYTAKWLNGTYTNSTGVAVLEVWGHVRYDVVVYKTGYGMVVEGRQVGYFVADNGGQGYLGAQDLTFTLTTVGYGTLKGYITQGTDDSPLEGAEVSVLFKYKGKQYWANSTKTDSSGYYEIEVNIGTWKVWVDRKVWVDELKAWNYTHLGTYFEVLMAADAELTRSIKLWPKGLMTINEVDVVEGVPEPTSFYVALINDTYGGILWMDELLVTELPVNVTLPAIKGWVVVIAPPPSMALYSVHVDLTNKASIYRLNATLAPYQYLIWSYPSDWEEDRLPGPMDVVAHVVDYTVEDGSIMPLEPVDPAPDSTVTLYTSLDRGYGNPTIWNLNVSAKRSGVGAYYETLDLSEAEPGYYPCIVAVRNSSGHFVALGFFYYNVFSYQVQRLEGKGKYRPSEHVVFKFLVYGSDGYADVDVVYAVYDDEWKYITGGYASESSYTFGLHNRPVTLYTVNVTAGTLPEGFKYHVVVSVEGGRELSYDFWVVDYTPVTFSGNVMNYTIIDLFSPEQGSYTFMADGEGSFEAELPPDVYDAWLHFDDKATPGMDARDASLMVTLTFDVTDFPTGFPEYQQRPVVPAFEVRGKVFHDVDGDGVLDPGEPVMPRISLRAQYVTGEEVEWRESEPDGSYRMFLEVGGLYRIIAVKGTYWQRTVPEATSTEPGDLLTVNVPLERLPSGIITGFVKLDNGTALPDAHLHFMDEYWTWIGTAKTNSTGGYLFEAPADKKLNVWVDPGPEVKGVQGRLLTDIMVGVDEVLVLNVTLYRVATVTGTVNVDVQILPLDENLHRVTWERWFPAGSFSMDLPINVRYLLLWAWGYVPRVVPVPPEPEAGGDLVGLEPGSVVDLGSIVMVPCSTDVIDMVAYPKGWEWTWPVGSSVEFVVELKNMTTWEPVIGAEVEYWAWYW
ncbi:MAG: hypothetical protein DRJ69_05510, partial [Thermoprotei archaeon]